MPITCIAFPYSPIDQSPYPQYLFLTCLYKVRQWTRNGHDMTWRGSHHDDLKWRQVQSFWRHKHVTWQCMTPTSCLLSTAFYSGSSHFSKVNYCCQLSGRSWQQSVLRLQVKDMGRTCQLINLLFINSYVFRIFQNLKNLCIIYFKDRNIRYRFVHI